MTLFTANEFVNELIEVERHKTLYVLGGFGLPATEKNKQRVKKAQSYNRTNGRNIMIDNASSDTFFFDCIGLVKAVLWGWYGDKTLNYGGATYASNGVPDTNCEGMIKLCHGVTSDFTHLEVGEFLYMKGHCGIYVGDGLAIECTPKWKNCVQYSYVANIGCNLGNCRVWDKHGKLPFIEYKKETKPVEVKYTAKSGDSISKLMKQGIITDKQAFIQKNGLKYPYWLYKGKEYKL